MFKRKKKTDAMAFITRLREANDELREKAEKQTFAEQLAIINKAKEKYEKKFLERHVEFVGDEFSGEFKRMISVEDGFAIKPWHIYIPIEGEVLLQSIIDYMYSEGWVFKEAEDGRLYIIPIIPPKPWWKKLWYKVQNAFVGADEACTEEEEECYVKDGEYDVSEFDDYAE